MRDSSSLFAQVFLLSHLRISLLSLCNLGPGNLKVSLTESISMPRNTSLVLGPSVFPGATGTPKTEHLARDFCRVRGSPVSQRPGNHGCHPLYRAFGGPTSVLLRRHCKSQGQTLNQMARLCRCKSCPPSTYPAAIYHVGAREPSFYIKLGHH